jgi:imidazolonepropionase-like amidohydrolase
MLLRKTVLAVLAVALPMAVVAVPMAQRRPPAATLFEGARLIVGDGRAPIENGAFLVEGSRISAIGKRGDVKAPASARRVDLTGKTVMPALLDLHGHLGYTKGMTDAAENYTRENMIDHLNRYAYAGVAAVVSLGADIGDLAYELRRDQHPGALLFTAGRGLAMPNAGPGQPMRPAAYGVSTEAEARQDVRELAAKHVDFIKIWVDDRNGTVQKLTPPLYRAIIDEAHKHNLRVIAHIFALSDAKDLMRSGVDAFAHLVRDRETDQELIDLIKKRPHFFFTLTLGGSERGTYRERPSWIDDPLVRDTISPAVLKRVVTQIEERKPENVERAKQTYAMMQRAVRKLNAAGVRITVGTDAGPGDQFFGWTTQHELELMVDAGLTPTEAIAAGTRVGAEVLGAKQLGTLAAGKSADFIVLDANPLDNIVNARKIAKVYLRGGEIDRAALKAAWTKRDYSRTP